MPKENANDKLKKWLEDGKERKLKKEIEVTFPSGDTVQLFEHEGKIVLGLVNSSGYYVSNTKLTITEARTMSRILNDFLSDEWLKAETED